MHFKSSAKLFTAILVPEVFLEIFLRERASEPLSGDIADNELRRGEREGLFSLSSQFRNGDLLFPGISASNTNFHFVNQLVRYEPIFIVDTNVQQLWIGSPAVFVEGRFSSRTQDDLYIPVSRFAPNYHHWHDGMYSISELLSPAIFVVRWSVHQEKRRRSVHSRETVRHHVSSWARRYVHHLHGKTRRSVE